MKYITRQGSDHGNEERKKNQQIPEPEEKYVYNHKIVLNIFI